MRGGAPNRSPSLQSGSQGSWMSPRTNRVTYSDRFIPSRSQSARVDYSLLDREVATSEVTFPALGNA